MAKPSADPPVTGLEGSPLGSGAQQQGWCCGASCDEGSTGRTLPIGPFWLDIENPTDEIVDQLATRLGLHPLAVEDSKQFGQRAKLQVYGNGAMLVGFGFSRRGWNYALLATRVPDLPACLFKYQPEQCPFGPSLA